LFARVSLEGYPPHDGGRGRADAGRFGSLSVVAVTVSHGSTCCSGGVVRQHLQLHLAGQAMVLLMLRGRPVKAP
jgi:hypothetical protein